jgi:hypothetical protein
MINCSRLRCFIKLPTEDEQLDEDIPPVVATTVTLPPSTQPPEAEPVKKTVSHVEESTGGTVDAPEVAVIEVSTTEQATKDDGEISESVVMGPTTRINSDEHEARLISESVVVGPTTRINSRARMNRWNMFWTQVTHRIPGR